RVARSSGWRNRPEAFSWIPHARNAYARVSLTLLKTCASSQPSMRPPRRTTKSIHKDLPFHCSEQLDVLVHNPLPLDLVGLRGPPVALRGAAKDDAVAARHHVDPEAARRLETHAADRVIADFRLRHHDRELPFQRNQLAIAEEIAGAETCAVHHDRLAK